MNWGRMRLRGGGRAAAILCIISLGGCVSEPSAQGDDSTGAVASAMVTGSIREAAASPAHLTAFTVAAAPNGFAGVCDRYGWACSAGGSRAAAGQGQLLAVARRINAEVNRAIRPMDDHRQYGRQEYWTLPDSGAGDCEDYALLKKKRLIEAGVPAGRLLLATAFNRRNEHHVVLVLRTTTADYVLDNLAGSVKTWQQTGYTFVKIQNENNKRRWDATLLGPRATRV